MAHFFPLLFLFNLWKNNTFVTQKMGQSVSSLIYPHCSNSVSPINYGDYEQLKSQPDNYQLKSQEEDTSCYISTKHIPCNSYS